MALYLVLEDYSDGSATIAAGSLLDDGAVDLARLQSAGLAAVLYNASTMSASREAFVAARGSRPVAPDTSGDLSALLLAAGAIGGSGGGVASVAGSAPITSSGGANPTIGIAAATPLAAGSMSAADKAKLDGIGTIVTSVTASGPLASSGGTTPDISLTAGTAPGDVMTWDGANWSGAAPAGGGTIGGTIAANEVAFGTGPDAIGGSAQLEWNPGTNTLTIADPTVAPVLQVDATSQINGKVTVTGGTASCFSIVSSIDGEFVSVDPSLFTVTVKDALSPADYYANISPSDVTVADNPAQTSGQVNGQGVQAFDAATSNFAALRVVSGVPTLLAQDTATTTDQPLDVVVGELRLAGNSGAAGEVLTSNGPGVAPTWQAGGGGVVSTEITDSYFVDAVLGDDLTADGSISKPFATVQACLVAIGNPTSKQDACRKITVYIAPAHSAGPGIIASQANNFDGIYQENLWVPCRMITFVGPGVKVGNAGDASGFGNITQEISTARRFGASSSELRHTMTFSGRANTRDTHQRIRNGFHVGGITRVSIIQRNIATIQGDAVGGTRVTITLAGGQNPYGVAVSPYAQLAVTFTDAGDVVGYTSPTGVAIANSANANQMVFVKSISGTTGPALDTYYYVVNATATTFQLSTSIGGAPISLTGDGTGVIMAKPGYAPFEDLVRFKVAGTTSYGTTATTVAYDIIEKVDDVTFIAKRVTGTNTSAAVESVGTITETDSTGSSTSITHDMAFDCCYQQGLVVHDDGVVYSGAPAAGANGALYAKESRFNAGFLASGVTVQRWENSQAVTTVNSGATVTSFSRTTNVVTVVTSATCQWSTGQVVTIASSASGGGQSIDGTWVIATGGTNTFTVSQTGADYGSQTPTATSTIAALSMWGTIVTMAQATFSGAGIQLGSTPFTLGSDDAGVSNTRFGVTRLYTTSTSALPLARLDAYTASWLYASGASIALPVTFTDAGDIVTKTAHGLSNGAVVRFSGIVNTTGISTATDYYVVGATATTFQLASTPGGAALPLTTNGTGTMDVLPTSYPAFLDVYVPTQLFTGNAWVQTSSVTAANTTTETNLTGAGVGMLNLPANYLKLGRNLRISGAGIFSCTASTPTLQLRIKLGATVIADTTAVVLPVAETNRGFAFDVNVAVRTTGATGTVFSNGQATRMATTLAAGPFNVLSAGVPAPVTVNTTTAQLLTVTATWSAADPSNSITLTNLTVSA